MGAGDDGTGHHRHRGPAPVPDHEPQQELVRFKDLRTELFELPIVHLFGTVWSPSRKPRSALDGIGFPFTTSEAFGRAYFDPEYRWAVSYRQNFLHFQLFNSDDTGRTSSRRLSRFDEVGHIDDALGRRIASSACQQAALQRRPVDAVHRSVALIPTWLPITTPAHDSTAA